MITNFSYTPLPMARLSRLLHPTSAILILYPASGLKIATIPLETAPRRAY
jgi:hypothetical protein